MYKEFGNIDALMQCINEDKTISGINSATAGRFPVRFVLFDSFNDCYDFVGRLMDNGVALSSVTEWLDPAFPDILINYVRLSEKIASLVRENETSDLAIAPFSELARFYDNETNKEFDALISTIKAIEATQNAFDAKQRVYIPIVGLEGKMSRFFPDSQIHIWYFKNPVARVNYRLILTNNTDYGVKGLEHNYSVVRNVNEWLRLWRDQQMKPNIICTSRSIFAFAEYAQPDNAFDFVTCNSCREFLTQGLGLKLEFLSHEGTTPVHWETLAKEINAISFDFKKFFNAKFDIHALAGHDVFIKTWFENNDSFDRWLLVSYYIEKFCDTGYICAALKEIKDYTNADIARELLLTIFDLKDPEAYIEERRDVLAFVRKEGIILSDGVQKKLVEKLIGIAQTHGYPTALRYFSLVTNAEKALLIEWLGKGYIQRDAVKELYPDIYHYLGRTFGVKDAECKWLLSYFDEYKLAKVANSYSPNIEESIGSHNQDTATFYSWYNSFSNTRTLLHSRKDIDVYYWIDGLGFDWVPFIQQIISERNNDNYYLNEVLAARSELPTKTDINKKSLQLLTQQDDLPKSGDLDKYSHITRQYPQYIIDDFALVRNTINKILNNNPGKKIAIVSDHGLSFLSQFLPGLNLPGLESDHGGRTALAKKPTIDSRYIILDDNKTLCALRHNSLCAKIHEGCGCHGGCTPEEVLVPIFIISSQPNAATWSATIEDFEISASNPVVKFKIKGIPIDQIAMVEYNGIEYQLNALPGDVYSTPNLPLDASAQTILLKIADKSQFFNLKLSLGTEEEDLFDF